MLDLQIDNITPLPLEEVVYSFEPLDIVDGQTRVLVAIARKATVNERVEALEAAGLQAEIVSVDALAMFRALGKRNLLATDDNRNVLVMLGPTTADVIVYSREVILAVRSIVLGADSESILREELQRTFVAAEAGQPQRARGNVIFLTQDEPSKLFAEKVASGLNAATSFLTNGAVPSPGLSLCLECAGSGAPSLNLLPDEWRQKRQTAAFRQRLIRGAIAVAVVYAAALAVFLTFPGVEEFTPVPAGQRNQQATGRVSQGEGITERVARHVQATRHEVFRPGGLARGRGTPARQRETDVVRLQEGPGGHHQGPGADTGPGARFPEPTGEMRPVLEGGGGTVRHGGGRLDEIWPHLYSQKLPRGQRPDILWLSRNESAICW